jgi:hypothetical protein
MGVSGYGDKFRRTTNCSFFRNYQPLHIPEKIPLVCLTAYEGDFRPDLDRPDIPLREIVVEGNLEVVEELVMPMDSTRNHFLHNLAKFYISDSPRTRNTSGF